MTKGRLDKKQRQDDQRRKRAQAASGLAQGAKSPARPIPVPSAAKRVSVGRATPLPPAPYPIKRVSLGKRQAPGAGG
jgi:hypothetical protein